MDDETRDHYILAWTNVLQICLEWTPEATQQWITGLLSHFREEDKHWLFHKSAMWWLPKEFVSKELRDRLSRKEYLYLLEEIVNALEDGNDYRSYVDRKETVEACGRVKEVLRRATDAESVAGS